MSGSVTVMLCKHYLLWRDTDTTGDITAADYIVTTSTTTATTAATAASITTNIRSVNARILLFGEEG